MTYLGDKFLILCKQLYFEKITPSGRLRNSSATCFELSKVAKQYFDNNRYREFAGFFQEGQYFIPLWAAHFLIENNNCPKDLNANALDIIKSYAENYLSPNVAAEEKQWLEKNIEES